jgi:hypothetical protein
MATGKAKRPKRRSRSESRDEGGAAAGDELVLLLGRDDPRSERRFEPRTSPATLLTWVGMSVGAVLAGSGAYGQWLRGEALGPSKYAPWLLGASAFTLFAVALFGRWGAAALRVGDAGVALEKDHGELERIAWHQITGVTHAVGMVTVQGPGTAIGIPVAVQPDAAALFASELAVRLPARAETLASAGLPPASSGAGTVLPLDPPQVAGLRCRKSDKIISFERDARFCGRCGELYHTASIPRRCLTCEALLRA